MSQIPFIRVDDNQLSIVLNNRSFTVTKDSDNFSEIVRLLNDPNVTSEQLLTLVDPSEKLSRDVAQSGFEGVTVEAGEVLFNGRPIHNSYADRIIQYMKIGLPTKPFICFLENLMANPSHRSVEQLPLFLDKKKIAVTPDGCFLAYKAVTSEYMDKYTNSIRNSIGVEITMPRNEVDDDPKSACSRGLHVGCIDYIKWYAEQSDLLLLVKVNPKDVVCVPYDHEGGKLRCCAYTPIALYKDLSEIPDINKLEELDDGVYSDSDGSPVDFYYNDTNEYDDEDDDEDDESIEQFIDRVSLEYDESFNRDDVCRMAARRGLYNTIEEARIAGKSAVCRALASNDW